MPKLGTVLSILKNTRDGANLALSMAGAAPTSLDSKRSIPSVQCQGRGWIGRRWYPYAIAFIFAIGIGVRLCYITNPPLDFHATRNFRSALVARHYYFRASPSIPEWRKQLADANMQSEGIMEPPIREFLASLIYEVTGGERIWVLRVMSAAFWAIGGIFLFLIARITTTPSIALFTVLLYLFFPFGIFASRSMLPDPFMVMGALISLYSILRYYGPPSSNRLYVAVATSAFALFIKPLCLFMIFGAFLSLAFYRQGLRNALFNRQLWFFLIGSLVPMALYYSYGMFIAGGPYSEIRDQAQKSFFPRLWLEFDYWKGWINNIRTVVGYPAFTLSIFAVFLIRDGALKALWFGLWSGYLIFGLLFTYHISTHDYYSLQLIPIVSLFLGLFIVRVTNDFWFSLQRRTPCLLCAALFTCLALSPTISGTGRTYLNHQFNEEVRIAREIGDLVGHSRRTVFLSLSYGKPLKYYGDVAGTWWPTNFEFASLSDNLTFDNNDIDRRFRLVASQRTPDFFIVTNMQALEKQQDLKRYLMQSFPLMARTQEYYIFDLREGQRPS